MEMPGVGPARPRRIKTVRPGLYHGQPGRIPASNPRKRGDCPLRPHRAVLRRIRRPGFHLPIQRHGKRLRFHRFRPLAAAGYRILSEQLSGETHAPDCPVLLICGKKDRQITNIYSRKWAAEAKLHVHWVEGAGHNANTDRPDIVNDLIETFLAALPSHQSPPR